MYFPTTQWSLLARASLNGETAARQALEELCRRYWSPLNQFIRLRGYSPAEAEDLTQDFLLDLLARAALKKADPLRGKFRSFLLGALMNFLADEYDRRQAQKRGGRAEHVVVDERLADLAPVNAGLLFGREWALTILENALRVLEEKFRESTEPSRFAVLRRFLPGSLQVPPYEEAAVELGISVPALKSELHRLRQRFKATVREEVARTVSAPHEIDEEMTHL